MCGLDLGPPSATHLELIFSCYARMDINHVVIHVSCHEAPWDTEEKFWGGDTARKALGYGAASSLYLMYLWGKCSYLSVIINTSIVQLLITTRGDFYADMHREVTTEGQNEFLNNWKRNRKVCMHSWVLDILLIAFFQRCELCIMYISYMALLYVRA